MDFFTGAMNLLLAYAAALAIIVYLSQELFAIEKRRDRLQRPGLHYDHMRILIHGIVEYSFFLPILAFFMYVYLAIEAMNGGDALHEKKAFLFALIDWGFRLVITVLVITVFYAFKRFLNQLYQEARHYMASGRES